MKSQGNIDIGARLQKARDDAGIDQLQAGKELGVSRSQISNWEKGVNGVSAIQLIRFSQIYGVAITQLLPGSDLLIQSKSMDDLMNIIRRQESEIVSIRKVIPPELEAILSKLNDKEIRELKAEFLGIAQHLFPAKVQSTGSGSRKVP